MKNKYNILFVFLAGALTGAGCKKDLNNFPANVHADRNLITDLNTAQTVLNGVYYRFADATSDADLFYTKWVDVNEQSPSALTGTMAAFNGGTDSTVSHNFSPAYGTVDSIWVYGYNLVNAASGFISNATPVNGIPATAKRQMLAEARFLRAFGNSELLFNFAQYRDPSSRYGIILRDSFVTAATINFPRSSVAAAYASILADLDVAIDGLPALNSAIYYANAPAAKLLKARVLMNRGAAGDYAQVIALTQDIIVNGPFTLEDSLKDIFLKKGLSSREVMLGIQPFPGQDSKTSWLGFAASDSFAQLLGGDARRQWMVYVNTEWYGDPFYQPAKYYIGDNPAYPDATPLSECSYAFRLSEAYLLEAEAITVSGGDLTAARALLKTVMSNGGAGAGEMAAVDDAITPAALQLEIVKENLRNFFCESGVDWLAIRRLPFATIQQLNPHITSADQLILPIPANELLYNNVIQNPGY